MGEHTFEMLQVILAFGHLPWLLLNSELIALFIHTWPSALHDVESAVDLHFAPTMQSHEAISENAVGVCRYDKVAFK